MTRIKTKEDHMLQQLTEVFNTLYRSLHILWIVLMLVILILSFTTKQRRAK